MCNIPETTQMSTSSARSAVIMKHTTMSFAASYWFCATNDPSYLPICEGCNGATITSSLTPKPAGLWDVLTYNHDTLDSRQNGVAENNHAEEAIGALEQHDYGVLRIVSEDMKLVLRRSVPGKETVLSFQFERGEGAMSSKSWNHTDEATERQQQDAAVRQFHTNLSCGRGIVAQYPCDTILALRYLPRISTLVKRKSCSLGNDKSYMSIKKVSYIRSIP
ncbi:hypothetical protein BKA64DRAFT_758428 [Cadophora sp. MPI-SDFR-AT-0126]|nr:hypothetical protein BKA64DRAFT_758428 [Leotiomycetes sp. MPI-SDFR-AT-0126]